MAAKSGVNLTVTGLVGTTPQGVSITYSVGNVPVALVDLAPAPPGVIEIKTNPAANLIKNPEKYKRVSEVKIDISVDSWQNGENKNNKLKFTGVFDGLSVTNGVGGNSYQAVVKHQSQVLLELTTFTPGLYPVSMNPYRICANSFSNPSGADHESAWGLIELTQDSKANPIVFYTAFLTRLLEVQLDDFDKKYLGVDTNLGQASITKALKDKRYKKAIEVALKLFKRIDLSAVTGGVMGKQPSTTVINELKSLYTTGSNIVLENYTNFLAQLGCVLLIGNDSMLVVPHNSVIQQELEVPSPQQLQKVPNVAFPADYSMYSYSDNGYRDIAHVILLRSNADMGKQLGESFNDVGVLGAYTEEDGLSNASGIYIANANIFVQRAATSPSALDSARQRELLDGGGNVGAPQTSGGFDQDYAAATATLKAVSQDIAKRAGEATPATSMDDYAKSLFFAMRYGDRTGAISMDFNTKWVPGTSGALYIRETNLWLVFYVVSVTHQVSLSVPNTGQATTVVNFSCGRLYAPKTSYPGIKKDPYLGYDIIKETAVRKNFLKDIGATT